VTAFKAEITLAKPGDRIFGEARRLTIDRSARPMSAAQLSSLVLSALWGDGRPIGLPEGMGDETAAREIRSACRALVASEALERSEMIRHHLILRWRSMFHINKIVQGKSYTIMRGNKELGILEKGPLRWTVRPHQTSSNHVLAAHDWPEFGHLAQARKYVLETLENVAA
jgi:hypothetical protein